MNTTPKKLQNVKFNFKPAAYDDSVCESCDADQHVYTVDSDFGPLSIDLCLDCIDPDYTHYSER